MDNEKLVALIQAGVDVKKNLELLYLQNIGLITAFVNIVVADHRNLFLPYRNILGLCPKPRGILWDPGSEDEGVLK